MTECIFCSIIKGDIPSKIIYKNEHVISFLDINPCSKGHSLIVPRKHFSMIDDASDDILKEIMTGARETMKLIKNKLHCDGFNLLINQGKDAGQVIDHFHLHVIPRYKNDKLSLSTLPHLKMTSEDLDLLHKEIIQ
ncbi:MAG: HIT family protein [Promethearchaeota archaeon]